MIKNSKIVAIRDPVKYVYSQLKSAFIFRLDYFFLIIRSFLVEINNKYYLIDIKII